MQLTSPAHDNGEATLVQLRAWLTKQNLPLGTRLPAERELSEIIGVSRGELRKSLSILEEEGQLWRHVGKGTFIGARRMELLDLAEINRVTNPSEVIRARLLIEPMLAREATLTATTEHLEALDNCIKRSESALTWRQYETADNDFHRTIARATGNQLLLALFDALNSVRRTMAWGQLRPSDNKPPPSHHSFAEHPAILKAIRDRDPEAAAQQMYTHLRNVQNKMTEGPKPS